jgi:hypothetical protein
VHTRTPTLADKRTHSHRHMTRVARPTHRTPGCGSLACLPTAPASRRRVRGTARCS